MRFIHTADWHLGRILFGIHLTADQEEILDRFYTLLGELRPELLIIAGDIYDRAVPPPEAVRLLDRFLSRVIRGLSIPTVILAGNHDSPDRLGFASDLLDGRGLFIRGTASPGTFVTRIDDGHGPVDIHALPYAEPPVIREVLEDGSITDHASAMAARLGRLRESVPHGHRTVIAAHGFVAGGRESESERPLSVGGSSAIDPGLFDGFHYVALGHLHRAQTAGAPHIQYSGSLFPYSFSEADTLKTVNLVDMAPDGQCIVTRVPLTPPRTLRIETGRMEDLMALPPSDDYIQATLLDKEPVLDAMGRLRSVFPNLLHIERPHLDGAGTAERPFGDHRKTGHKDLFAAFFRTVTGDTLTPDMETAYGRIVDGLMRKEREAL